MNTIQRYTVRVREVVVREVVVSADSKHKARWKARNGDWLTAGDPECHAQSIVGKVYVEGQEPEAAK
jgi:hypothetical protein